MKVASFALNRARIREIPVQKPAPGVMISFPFLRKLRSISVSNLSRKTFVLSQDSRPSGMSPEQFLPDKNKRYSVKK